MTNPWEDFPELWKDEVAYCQWLRSQSRRIWSRHPIKISLLKAGAIPVTPELRDRLGLSKAAKKVYRCDICGCYHIAKNIEVDHIEGAGSFKTVDEWHIWLDRLLRVGMKDLRILCKPCHAIVTFSQKAHCTFEEAVILKQIVEFKKLKPARQLAKLRELGVMEAPELRNAVGRVRLFARLNGNGKLWEQYERGEKHE